MTPYLVGENQADRRFGLVLVARYTPPPNEGISAAFKHLKETSGVQRVNTLADFDSYKRTLLEHIQGLLTC